MNLRKAFNTAGYYGRQTKQIAKDICRGFNFMAKPESMRVWKGVNAAYTAYSGYHLAFNVAAAGAAGVVSAPALFTGIGLAIAYNYGRQSYRW